MITRSIATRSGIVALALLAFTARPAAAQRTLRTLGEDAWHTGTDIVGVFASPLHADGRDWLGAAAAVGVSAAVTPYDDDVDRWIQSHPHSFLEHATRALRQDAPHGRWGDLFTQNHILNTMAPLYAVGFIANQRGIRDAATGCLSAAYASGLFRTGLYAVVSRDRPSNRPASVQGDQYQFDWGHRTWSHQSFFGGHVANTTACVSYWGARYHLGVAEPLLYGYAAGVAVARQYDRRHWTSDNLLGALFGLAVGRVVAHRSLARRDALERKDDGRSAALPREPRFGEPIFGGTTDGTVVGWQLRFR